MASLTQISLTNFRGFSQLDLDLPLGVVVLSGGNAQGKTTLLEAAYILAIARSFRAENEREVVSFRAGTAGEQALVLGTAETRTGRLSLAVGYQPVSSPQPAIGDSADSGGLPARDGLGYSVRKQVRADRQRKTAAGLVGLMGATLFHAGDVDLIYGPPSERRRYLDILISQADPIYIRSLQRCQQVVRRRNRLLRMVREGQAGFRRNGVLGPGAGQGRGLDHLAASAGDAAPVGLGGEHHAQLGEEGDEFRLEYRPSVPGSNELAATETGFWEKLAVAHQRELATATTVVGPHRDDFRLLVNGLDMGTFASRGEARTLALTLRLAEASYLWEARGRRTGPPAGRRTLRDGRAAAAAGLGQADSVPAGSHHHHRSPGSPAAPGRPRHLPGSGRRKGLCRSPGMSRPAWYRVNPDSAGRIGY